jgi:hypothetical protein
MFLIPQQTGGMTMPLKLNVGLMKKIGQPRYGSLCASCHVEVELESSLLELDAEAFHERARKTFAACRRAVETELAVSDLRRPDCLPATIDMANCDAANCHGTNHVAASQAAKNGVAMTSVAVGDPGASNGNGNLLPASASQLDYVRRLANRIGRAAALRVETLAQRRFCKPLVKLSRAEATRLILTLRAVKAGELDWETVLEESTG